MTKNMTPAERWADWLIDAVATATQDRRFLRGDPDEDKIATEAIYANGKKAIENAIRTASGES
jgi:hypothetical protein